MSKIRLASLRTKIVAWSFVPTAIILVAVALVTFYAYQRETEALVIERDQEVTRLAAGQFATELADYADMLIAVARTVGVNAGDPATRGVALQRAGTRLAVFDGGVILLDKFGTVVAAEPKRPDILGQNRSDRPYFRELVRSRKPGFSDVVSDGPEGKEVVVVGVPIIGQDDEFNGSVAGMFRLGEVTVSTFYGGIVKLRISETGTAYLVDGNGRVIYHVDEGRIGDDFSTQPVVQQVLDGHVGATRTRDASGQDIVAGFAPVPGTSWGLVTEESWATLTSGSRRYQQFLLLLLVSGVLVPALVVAFGVRRITRPLAELVAAAQEVAEGKFGQSIAVRTDDELQDLAEQFNLMSAQLQESYAYLELRVADRTRELAALYDVTALASESMDLDTTLKRSLDRVLAAMGSEIGAIHLLNDARQTLILSTSRGIPVEVLAKLDGVPLSGLTGWVIEHGNPLVVPEIARGPRPLRAIPAAGSQAYIGAPMRARGRVLGVLSVVAEAGRQFTAEEVALLASIADEVALAVDNARLRAQAEQLAVMKERERLARELHDSVTQSLYSLSLYAEAGRRLAGTGHTDQVEGYLDQVAETARQALMEMRLLVYNLRPLALERDGLVGALKHRLDAVERRAGVDARLEIDGPTDLPVDVEADLYRIAQEALNNALKHAGASLVTVSIHRNGGHVALEITDDGHGFDPAGVSDKGGMGLASMRERAEELHGTLAIDSTPGAGTKVRVQVPKEFYT